MSVSGYSSGHGTEMDPQSQCSGNLDDGGEAVVPLARQRRVEPFPAHPHASGEFAKIANHLRFLYVFSLLERNKRIRLGQVPSYFKLGSAIDIGRRETAFDRKIGEAHHQLEAYFPFDPYHLPQSKKWIEGEFNAWQLPRGMKQDDDDEEDDEESDEEEEYESDEESLPRDLAVQPPVSSGILAMSGN